MSLVNDFDAFLEGTVNLNPTRIGNLNEKVEAITNFLRGHPTFADLFVDVTPQGSYAHRTIIKPVGNGEYDADVLLVLHQHPTWTPAMYTAELAAALRSSGIYKDKVHKRSRCVCVDYTGDFHIDIVPYVESRWAITNNKGGIDGAGQWQTAYPEKFTEWLEGKYRLTNDHMPDVIRLLKYLRDYKKTFSVKSVILSILVGNVVTGFNALDPSAYPDLPTTIVRVLEDLARYVAGHATMPPITDPAGSGQDFQHRWDQNGYANFRKWIQYYAIKARAALDAGEADGLAIWQDIFGTNFKMAAAPAVTASVASSGEQNLASLGIVENLTERVHLVGRVRQRGVQRAYDLPTRGDQVSKGRSIDFRIESCTVTGSYDVFWKVKNYGQEALDANCPRGQIVRGDTTRWEQTAYRGNHYVEVYVVQNGICVARDQQRVIVTNLR